MDLKQLILGTSLVVGLAGCVGIMASVEKGCYMKSGLRMCTDYVENGQITFYRGFKDDKPFCGMRGLYPDRWFSIVDQGCDGAADIYQEGNDKGVTNHLWREREVESYLWTKKDKERFEKEFDPELAKARDMVWKRRMKLRSLVLGLVVGLGACTTESDSHWGKRSENSFSKITRDSEFHIQDFEKAVLMYSQDNSNPAFCVAAVYEPRPIITLDNLKFDIPQRLIYDKNNLGYVLMDIGCDGAVETKIENTFPRVQSILPREENQELFKNELDPLYADIKNEAKGEPKPKKQFKRFSKEDLIIFIQNINRFY